MQWQKINVCSVFVSVYHRHVSNRQGLDFTYTNNICLSRTLSFVLHYRDVQTCHFVLNGFISSCLSQTLLYSALFCLLCIWLYFCISLFLYLQSGLTPLHLAAQEDKVNVAEVLCNQGAFIDPETKVMIASSCLWIKIIKAFAKWICLSCHFTAVN